MQRLTGRTALITGAGSGIGQATVHRFLREGAHVIAADVAPAGLEETLRCARAAGLDDRLTVVEVDISQESSVQKNLGEAIKAAGGLQILVNAAGILRSCHTHQMTLDFWNHILAVNLTGTFLVTREALPALLENSTSVVVNFSSTSASFAHPYMAAYAATKGGIQSFTHTLASEYARQGLRAVAVAPGSIASGMTNDPGIPPDADMSLFSKMMPAIGQGFASPDSVAGVIAMFASDDGEFITGTELRIDGGTHM